MLPLLPNRAMTQYDQKAATFYNLLQSVEESIIITVSVMLAIQPPLPLSKVGNAILLSRW